jgi:tellurite methyltransferase
VTARERWNRRYSERRPGPFSSPPSEWLLESRPLLPDGRGRRALDVACGGGRNAAWLAELGFAVDAVDISDVAIEALRAAALDRGLTVNALRIDLERDPLPVIEYDVIVQIDYLQRDLMPALVRAVAPGGVLIAETVTRAHVEELGNRFDPRFLLEPGELPASVGALEVLRYEESVVERSAKPRAIASIVARRGADSWSAPG